MPFMLVNGLLSLLFFVAFIVLVAMLVKRYRKGQLQMPKFAGMRASMVENDPYLSALKLLNERLANGDIDVDEYYARRTALKGPDPTGQA